jgi:putative ABC transport system substrate-binding protein
MDRRTILRGAGLGTILVSVDGLAQRAGAMPRIGLLTPGANPREPAFWQGMRDLGYIDGKTMVVDRRSAEGDFSRLPTLAREIVVNRPEAIVAIASASTSAVSRATSSIPIVMVGVADPIAEGFVGDLSHPGGNITGTSTESNAVIGKVLELLRQVLPGAARIAILWDPVNALSQQLRLGQTLIAAARLHLLATVIEVQTRVDLDRTFATFGSSQPDAVLVSSDTFILNNAQRVAELALAQHVPVFSTSRSLTEAGILASYGADTATYARRAATYVQRILRGAKPADLPIEQPTKFELILNAGTAKALGIALPPAVVARASEVM